MSTVGPGHLERQLLEKATPKELLLIDDSEEDKSMIEFFSAGYNCSWSWAKDYDHAVAILASKGKGFFKLVFLDLRLGSYEECFRVYSHIKRAKLAPVAVLSGQLDLTAMRQLNKIGPALCFIEKPANFDQDFFDDLFQMFDIRPRVN